MHAGWRTYLRQQGRLLQAELLPKVRRASPLHRQLRHCLQARARFSAPMLPLRERTKRGVHLGSPSGFGLQLLFHAVESLRP